MNQTTDSGPGTIGTHDVGARTIATTALLDSRRIMAYAAGINDRNPRYFDDTRADGLCVHPGIAFSLQWQSRFRPDRQGNPRAGRYSVHAYTDLKIRAPFKPGQAVTTQGRTIGRRQIPPGVYTIERYYMSDGQGTLLAELDYNGIIRGGTLDGPDVLLEEEPPVPVVDISTATPIAEKEVYVPLHAGQQYTECAAIYNPIHTERSVAEAAGLPDIILHGSATKAIALTGIIDECFDGDPERIRRLTGQLRAMVLMDTTIRLQILADEERDGERLVAYRVLNEAGQPAIAGGLVVGVQGLMGRRK